MTSKFEQLIEYVINDEEGKARELFHDIVVEKSREIYENLMNEESEEDLDEAKEEDEEGEELDESEESDDEEELDEGAIGGDASQGLIDDVEMEEEGMCAEEEGEEEVEFGAEEEGGEDLEDRVVDLEDKLDELMAEFEAMMGDEGAADDFGAEGGDELEMDDTAEFDDGEEEEVSFDELSENVALKAAPTPVKSEEGSINKKSTTAFNSGAAGMEGSPVKPTGTEAKGRPAPSTKELIGKVGNSPAQATQKPTPATKPTLSQAAGVNTKTPFPKG